MNLFRNQRLDQRAVEAEVETHGHGHGPRAKVEIKAEVDLGHRAQASRPTIGIQTYETRQWQPVEVRQVALKMVEEPEIRRVMVGTAPEQGYHDVQGALELALVRVINNLADSTAVKPKSVKVSKNPAKDDCATADPADQCAELQATAQEIYTAFDVDFTETTKAVLVQLIKDNMVELQKAIKKSQQAS